MCSLARFFLFFIEYNVVLSSGGYKEASIAKAARTYDRLKLSV